MDSVAKMIDHTNLKAFAQKKDIEKLCQEAKEHGFASVCVNSVWVKTAAALLAGTDSQGHHVKTCTVVGFPLGAMSHEAKAFETTQAVNDGAEEIDMVIDIGAAKDGRWDDVKSDISGIVKAAKEKNALVKVILENCYLTKEEIEKACLCCVECGADFVKTSTGFGTGGATPEDVALMKKTVNGKALVKAAGGIRDKDSAQKMIEAGADRLGCSAGIAIVAG